MCGICGTKGIALASIEKERTAMLDALQHRGPDEKGHCCDPEEDLFLGATRLSIIDLTPAGSQPLYNENRTLILVCNGEIYNAPALREELLGKGHCFHSRTDAEVILHLYEDMGERCLDKLKGMFAFALWDKRQKSLFMARDRLGIKPLYYYAEDRRFAFASEIKALLKLPFIKKEIDPRALDLYFSLEYIPAPLSIYKGIRKLMPGSYLTLRGGEARERSYWSLGAYEPGNAPDFHEASERLESLLKKAVKQHLVADVPVGVLLSGGLDSSMLAAMVCREQAGGCDTFSIGFDEKNFDETEYAREAARFLNSRHHHQVFTLKDFTRIFPFVTGHLDEPLGDLSVFPTYFLSRFTRQGVKTALSGEGGDELFMGYPTYLAHKFLEDYRAIPAGLIHGVFHIFERIFPPHSGYFSHGFKIRQFLRAKKCLRDPVARHQSWMGAFSDEEKNGFFSEATRERILTSPEKGMIPRIFTEQDIPDPLKKIQQHDLCGYLAEDLLVKADRASMAASLELRVPYLDHELVEFVWKLPTGMIFQKRLLRSVAAKYLPPMILRRRKKGFAIPFTRWLGTKEFFPCVEEFFDPGYVHRQGLFDAAAVRQMLREHRDRKKDHRKKLGAYIMFQAWHKKESPQL